MPDVARAPCGGEPLRIDPGRAVREILTARHRVPANRAVLAGVSGIDGSGKGWVTARLVEGLRRAGRRPAAINVDGWLNLPDRRFDPRRHAEHFYEHAIRLDEMFARLVLPLRDRRTHEIEFDLAEETAREYRRERVAFTGVDVIVLEGIYLFKRAYRRHFDLAMWVECSFETALERALRRAQEGLPPPETIRAYETIYFPAQRIHFERDDPRRGADFLIGNDPRLEGGGADPAR